MNMFDSFDISASGLTAQRLRMDVIAENVANAVGGAVKNVTEDFIYKKDEIMAEIQYFVNNRVNRSSKIGSVQTVDEFEKTASQKIKRYKYTLKSATEDSTKKD